MVSKQDHLSEVLETFPLDVFFVGRFEMGAPWGLILPEGMALICSVARGTCLAAADTNSEKIVASSGDILLLSPGAEHRLQDQIDSPLARPEEWIQSKHPDDPLVVSLGKTIPTTTFYGGVFRFEDPQIHPFYWGLPPLVHLTQDIANHSAHLRRLVHSIDDELSTNLPGRLSIARRLFEILFIETARLHLTSTDDEQNASMGHLLHPDLGPALTLMHRHPEKSWTVAELAERVAMSRSAFATVFVKVLGRPPVTYLRERRMQLAERLLRNQSLGLKEIAQRVGYDSVSAFNSAFKQWRGIAPGRYRVQTKSG